MDWAMFGMTTAAAVIAVVTTKGLPHQSKKRLKCKNNNDDDEDATGIDMDALHLVDRDNMDLDLPMPQRSSALAVALDAVDAAPPSYYYRASYVLVMHEPPNLYYEPKEWTQTQVVLFSSDSYSNDGEDDEDISSGHPHNQLRLPGGPVGKGELYQDCAVRRLLSEHGIDVCRPENCLHHLFTFFLERECIVANQKTRGVWADFYECVFRGNLDQLKDIAAATNSSTWECYLLSDLKEMVDNPHTCNKRFVPETGHALKLYFQRQGDLYVQRRLLKSYSSVDLEHYGLRRSDSGTNNNNRSHGANKKIVFLDTNSFQRQQAVEFTMKTDDGMSPKLLPQADIVLLGVSRTGKSPLSLFLAQTTGLKVSNVPLVQECPPPKQLLQQVDPKRVFCLTMDALQLQNLRRTRFRREFKKHLSGQQHCVYADADYVVRDLEYARSLAHAEGYTELNVTNRAMEETANIIVQKIKERFPDMHVI